MARKLTDQEIFAVGRWNGDVYSEADLDEIVKAFNTLKLPVPLKLGHTEAQKWFGQEDGAPALGWVEGVRRIGTKLVADFANVPEALAGLIANRNYRTKSAEIYWNFTSPDGQKWPRALKAVSLLGADPPAVTTLNDLQTVLMSSDTYSMKRCTERMESSDGKTTITYTPEWKAYQWDDGQEETMDKELEKKYTDQISSLEGKVKDETKRAEDAEARAIKAEATLAQRDEAHAVQQFSLKVDGLIKEGKILPKEKDGLIRQYVALGAGKKTYQEKEFSPREEMIASLEARDKIVDFEHRAKGGDLKTGDDDAPASVRVFNLAKKFQRDHKLDYNGAIAKVREDEPELWREYMNSGKGGE